MNIKMLIKKSIRKKIDDIYQKTSKISENYLSKYKLKKLHIGCGSNLLSGWLNSDLWRRSGKVICVDVTKKFPFLSETFHYVFSEHTIEHVSYSDGFRMLSECYYVLKNNGKIRISTPNFQFLIDLYVNNKSETQKEYIKWSSDSFIKSAPCYDPIFVINNFVRDWGHLFIYDEKTLRLSMEKAGFTNIQRCELNESQDELLCNLEHETRLPKGFLKLESLTLEGTKRNS